MKRTTLRTNIETKAKDWLKFGIAQSIGFSENSANRFADTRSNNVNSPSTVAASWPRYWEPYSMKSTHQVWGTDSWGMLFDPNYYVDAAPSKTENLVYNGTAFAEITPVKGLTLRSQLGLYAIGNRVKNVIMPSYAQLADGGTGSAARKSVQSSSWTITNTAEYKFNVNDNNHFTLLLGQEGIKASYDEFTAQADGLLDDRLTNLSAGTVQQPQASRTTSTSTCHSSAVPTMTTSKSTMPTLPCALMPRHDLVSRTAAPCSTVAV